MRGRRRHLEPIDEAGVVADYEAGATLATIRQHYDIGLTRLYRILDHHQVPRRRPTAPRLGNRVRQRVLADYRAGMPIGDIAHKHGISPACGRSPTSTAERVRRRLAEVLTEGWGRTV